MPSPCLTRRRTQLELLSAMCAGRQRARVCVPGQDPGKTTVNTRFLALEDESLLLEWPLSPLGVLAGNGRELEVFFEHEGERFAFRSAGLGRVWWVCPRRGHVAAWSMELPLRIDRRQQRSNFRVSLADLAPIPVHFTCTADEASGFAARLVNISAGGLGAVAQADQPATAAVGELHWVRFRLPSQGSPFEFVVRIKHVHTLDPSGTVVLGCVFCGGDDASTQRAHVRRIEQFVAERQRAQLRRAGVRATEGA